MNGNLLNRCWCCCSWHFRIKLLHFRINMCRIYNTQHSLCTQYTSLFTLWILYHKSYALHKHMKIPLKKFLTEFSNYKFVSHKKKSPTVFMHSHGFHYYGVNCRCWKEKRTKQITPTCDSHEISPPVLLFYFGSVKNKTQRLN